MRALQPSTPTTPKRRGRWRLLLLRAVGAAVAGAILLQGTAHLLLLGRTRGPGTDGGSRPAARRALSELALGKGTLGGSASSWAPSGDLLQSAAELERWLEGHAAVALCGGGQPLLPGMPAAVCRPHPFCLWSHALQADVDLAPGLFQLRGAAGAEPCPIAQGGQAGRPAVAAQPPLVSFVLLPSTDDRLAAETLAQLFYTAHEAPSAEFIVVEPLGAAQTANSSSGDGSSSASGGRLAATYSLLSALCSHLRASFGAELRVLDTAQRSGAEAGQQPAAGQWADAQAGLTAALGTYVIVLQAGALPLRGWLHVLLATLESRPRAALVGPLVLSPTGAVAQAGGTLYSDGSFALQGAGVDLASPEAAGELLHLQLVDFVGAPCLALRREAALAAGGFAATGPRAQALGELDLALVVQQRGQEVLLQPLSMVLLAPHLQQHNQQQMQEPQVVQAQQALVVKWEQPLRQRHCPPPVRLPKRGASLLLGEEVSTDAAHSSLSARRRGPHLLWVDDTVPTPDKDSGSVRLMALLRILLQVGYRISFQPRQDADRPYNVALQAAGVLVLPAEALVLRADGAGARPQGSCLYDGFVVSRRGNYNRTAALLDKACPGVPQVFDTVDLHFVREVRQDLARRGLPGAPPDLVRWLDEAAPAAAQRNAGVAALLRLKRKELELAERASATLVVSPDEAEVLRHYLPPAAAGRVHVVSNVYEAPPPEAGAPSAAACAQRRGLLFVGNLNHRPNAEAVKFLTQHVMPRIRAQVPPAVANSMQLHIVGSGALPPALAQELAGPGGEGLVFHGYLPDDLLALLYSSVRVVVAPLTTGAGVKGKVNQAMAAGVPVVATPIAVEGMQATDGVDCLVAATAGDFARKVVEVFGDCELWGRLARGGLENLRRHFSADRARETLLRVLTGLGLPPPDPLAPAECSRGGAGAAA